MNRLGDIIHEAAHGSPEKALHDLEGYLAPLVGDLPDNRDTMALWVNSACAVFYLLRFVQLARYYPDGHTRIDLLHKAAGLMPEHSPIDVEV